MNSKLRSIRWALPAALLVVCAGCGASHGQRPEVLGFVLLDGNPVEQAAVFLSPRVPGQGDSISGTVADGVFSFSSVNGPKPGSYEVILQPVEPDAEDVLSQVRQRKSQLLAERNRFLQAVQRKGPVVVEVTSDLINEIAIELTSR